MSGEQDAQLKLSLKTDSGFCSETSCRITLQQWAAINVILDHHDLAKNFIEELKNRKP